MEKWEALRRQSRAGILMQDRDLGELYSLLRLFRNTYSICEQEADTLLQSICDLYRLQSGIQDEETALMELKNPRQAGRKKTITPEQCHAVRELHGTGMPVREIAACTGISKSSVQRILKDVVSRN